MKICFQDISARHLQQAVEFANAHRDDGQAELLIEDEGATAFAPDALIIRTADEERAGFRIAQWNLDTLGIGSRGDLTVSTFHDRSAAKRLITALLHFD